MPLKKPMKSSRIPRNMECIESSLKSNVSKLISYLGLFPTYNELSAGIIKEIEQTAIAIRKKPDTPLELSAQNPETQPVDTELATVVPTLSESTSNPLLADSEKSISKNLNITFFTYEEMEEPIVSLLFSQDLLPINLLDFRRAFKALDPSGQNWIKQSTLVYMLKRVEPPFTDEEIANFMLFVGNKKTPERVYYEDYLINFYEFVNSHIKKLYQANVSQR